MTTQTVTVWCVQKMVADLKLVMDAVFPLVPGEKIHDRRLPSLPTESHTVGVWTSFPGVPLDERIRDCMNAIPRRLECTNSEPQLVACLSPGPSLSMARLHKALQVWPQTQNLHRI